MKTLLLVRRLRGKKKKNHDPERSFYTTHLMCYGKFILENVAWKVLLCYGKFIKENVVEKVLYIF